MKAVIFKAVFAAAIITSYTNVAAQVGKVKLTVHVPGITAKDKGVFVAGSFNYWHQADTLYRMTDIGHGNYSLSIPVFYAVNYQYKYCLGTWDRVEIAANDSNIANRRFTASKKIHIKDTVIKWKQLKPAADSSEQLKRFTAMKDSLLLKLKPEMEQFMGMLKLYAQNMLQAAPNIDKHHRLDDSAAEKIGHIYRQVTGLLWNICNSFTAEQRQAILKKLNDPSEKDFFNSFLDAINTGAK